MANTLAHFSINANDVERAARFYGGVFGWKFQAWGPPGFYMIEMPQATMPMRASLQQRRDLVEGMPLNGMECTFAVENARETAAAVEAHGGEIVMPLCTLPGIGHLFFFKDPEGNVAGAMEYDATAK